MTTATQKQWDFAVSLGRELRQLAGDDPERTAIVDTLAQAVKRDTVNRTAMSAHIDAMIGYRDDWRQDTKVLHRDESVLEGVHLLDGAFIKVQRNRDGTHHYAKRWNADAEQWDYEGRKPLALLSQDTKLDAEQAAAFGHLYGQCVYCSSVLTDERSIAVGYGPTCADNHGLPWGASHQEPAQSALDLLNEADERGPAPDCQHANRAMCADGCCWQCPDCGEAS
jgi:hypothetical protein